MRFIKEYIYEKEKVYSAKAMAFRRVLRKKLKVLTGLKAGEAAKCSELFEHKGVVDLCWEFTERKSKVFTRQP